MNRTANCGLGQGRADGKTKNRCLPMIRKAMLAALFLSLLLFSSAQAAPPVRIAVVPGGGSGQEQEVVDQISNRLQEMQQTVALSTVNPDWYVVCNIKENTDQVSGQIRYNGTVIIKTNTDPATILGTVAVQKYNQDFSLQPGAPLN